MRAVVEALQRQAELRGGPMRAPDEVAAMVRLKALGWGVRRIAVELGCSHMTVRRYLDAGGWIAYRRPRRATRLAGLEAWLAERFRRHRGNADVVRQELAREHGITVSLRTVERAVQELRRELVAEAKATVRFETPPGRQLQIDFGSTTRRHRRRARARLPVRGDARLLAARVCRRLPPRAPECLARRPRARVPALRRCARRAAARQRQGTRHPSRPAHPRGTSSTTASMPSAGARGVRRGPVRLTARGPRKDERERSAMWRPTPSQGATSHPGPRSKRISAGFGTREVADRRRPAGAISARRTIERFHRRSRRRRLRPLPARPPFRSVPRG